MEGKTRGEELSTADEGRRRQSRRRDKELTKSERAEEQEAKQMNAEGKGEGTEKDVARGDERRKGKEMRYRTKLMEVKTRDGEEKRK